MHRFFICNTCIKIRNLCIKLLKKTINNLYIDTFVKNVGSGVVTVVSLSCHFFCHLTLCFWVTGSHCVKGSTFVWNIMNRWHDTWWQCSIWKTWILICKEISTTDLTLVDFFLVLTSAWIVRGCLIPEFDFFKRKHLLFEDWNKYWSNNHCTFTVLWFC